MKAVIFDLENTLVLNSYTEKTNEVIYSLISDKLRISREEARNLFKTFRKLYPTTTATIVALGIPLSLFYSCLNSISFNGDSLCSMPYANEVIALLKKAGIKVGLLTNVPHVLSQKILQSANINLSYFDAIVAGDDVKKKKPSREPIVKILKQLNISPKNAIVVGDRTRVDLQPCKKIGVTTILLTSNKYTKKNVDYVITDLRDISRILKI